MRQDIERRDREAQHRQDQLQKQVTALQAAMGRAGVEEQKAVIGRKIDALRAQARLIRISRETSRRRELDRLEQLRRARKKYR